MNDWLRGSRKAVAVGVLQMRVLPEFSIEWAL